MRISFFTTLLLILCVFVFSCQKELQPLSPSQPGTTDSTTNGSDTTHTGSDTSSTSSAAYQPLTTGSWWKYQDSTTATTSVNTLAAPAKTINGVLYNALVSVTGTQTDTLWTAAPSHKYYLVAQGVSPNTGDPYDLTFYYLNDTASVGYNLKYNAGSGNGFTAYITTTLIAKNLTMTIAGKTYTNVTQTRLDLSYDVLGTVTEYGNYNYFTAKGIGIVKIRAEVTLSGVSVLQTCSDLIDYSIK